MKLVQNRNIDLEKWDKLVGLSPFTTPFQTNSFYHFYNIVPGFSADVFAIEENNEYTSLIVVTIQKESGLKAFFSRRGIIYGGPLILNNNERSLTLLLNSIFDYYKSKLIYLEIRNFKDYSYFDFQFKSQLFHFLPYLNLTINTSNKSTSELIQDMKYNRRREIKLSLEQKAYFKECESEEELISLYSILKELYSEKVKLPLPDIAFFKQFWNNNIGKVFIVTHDGKVIGGSICTLLINHSIFTMYYCGLRNYNKKIFPTHLAVLAAIDCAVKNKCMLLDFMGAGLKDNQYGVRNYKKEFGSTQNEFGRYRRIIKPFLFKIGVLAISLFKKLK